MYIQPRAGRFSRCQALAVRKHFSYFGDFGTPGVGYDTERPAKETKKILRLDVVQKVALVGVGNLGSAILAYTGLGIYGFDIAATFDIDLKKVGRKIKNIVIEDVSNLQALKNRKINAAIIAVPQESAQQKADALVRAGPRSCLRQEDAGAASHNGSPKSESDNY